MKNYISKYNKKLVELTGAHWNLSVNFSELECKAIYALHAYAIFNSFLLGDYDPCFGFGVVEVGNGEYLLLYYDPERDLCTCIRSFDNYDIVMAAFCLLTSRNT